MKRILAYILLLLPLASAAQGDVEYKMEIGGGVGLVNYLGDYNGSLLKNLQPMASLKLRRVFNPYMAICFDVSAGKLKGSYESKNNYYLTTPDKKEFSNPLYDASLVYEYNFWPYGTGRDYFRAKRFSPFISLGIGGTVVKTPEKTYFTGNLPLGLGVKFKIADRVNLGVEWAMHFTLSDKLDGVEDPYGIKSTGPFKNTDCYSALKVSLTYSFLPKCSTCNPEK